MGKFGLTKRCRRPRRAWTNGCPHSLPCCRERLKTMNLDRHDLRREAGSRLLERGADLHTVQLFLDHANISTSSRYLKPSKLALHTTIQRIDAQRRRAAKRQNGSRTWPRCRGICRRGHKKGHTDYGNPFREDIASPQFFYLVKQPLPIPGLHGPCDDGTHGVCRAVHRSFRRLR